MKIQIKAGIVSAPYPMFYLFFNNNSMFNVENNRLHSSFSLRRLKNKNFRRRLQKLWEIHSWL